MARNPKNTRMCIACRERFNKSELLCLTKTKDGIIFSDLSLHTEGRSVYLCALQKCLDTAIKRNALSRSLKCEIEPEILEAIQKAVKTE